MFYILKPYPQNNETQYFLGRDAIFEALPIDTNDIVFLGNSLTQNFILSEFFNNPEIKNRGVSGDNISGVLNRLHPVVLGKPAKVFLMLGVNDLGHGKSVSETISKYKEILESLKKNDQTEIFIQSALPVSAECPYGDINDKIEQLNQCLQNLSMEFNVVYIDLHQEFILENELNPNYHIDGIHLNAEGYILWKKIIFNYL